MNQPLNPPRQDSSIYNHPAPPIDPNNIFGSPSNNQAPSWNSYPVFPIQTQRNSQYPYPQIPQSQPMPQYPYNGGQLPYNPPPPQQPYAFGNPPPQRSNYPSYYTTTKEPNLWNQFLYNKQGGKKNSGHSISTTASSHITFVLSIAAISMMMMFHVAC